MIRDLLLRPILWLLFRRVREHQRRVRELNRYLDGLDQ